MQRAAHKEISLVVPQPINANSGYLFPMARRFLIESRKKVDCSYWPSPCLRWGRPLAITKPPACYHRVPRGAEARSYSTPNLIIQVVQHMSISMVAAVEGVVAVGWSGASSVGRGLSAASMVCGPSKVGGEVFKFWSARSTSLLTRRP